MIVNINQAARKNRNVSADALIILKPAYFARVSTVAIQGQAPPECSKPVRLVQLPQSGLAKGFARERVCISSTDFDIAAKATQPPRSTDQPVEIHRAAV